MIKTYRLYHDGLVVQTWSHSYHDAALRQLARETLPGTWELQLVSLHPRTLIETQCNVARRVIEPDLVKDVTEYVIFHNNIQQPSLPNIYDARKAWRHALTQSGTWSIYLVKNGIPERHLASADVAMGEDWL